MRGDCQEVHATKSRRSGPRRWLDAVRWLIAAGYHGVNATTLRVAEDLASRMDYDLGHVLYRLKETAKRLGMSVSNLKKHVKKLRELGALVWVVHGTKTNIRRLRGLSGYAGTATVYGAVIPPEYDHAKGHILIGSGYDARIIIDERGKAPALPAPRTPVDNPPVENPGTEGREPPSRTGLIQEVPLQDVDGFTTTAKRQPKTSPTQKRSSKKRATILGNTVTAAGMQLGDKLARAIRRRVPWTRRATHNELRWICADMGENGWTEQQAVAFAAEAGAIRGSDAAWQARTPHRVLAAELREYQQQIETEEQRQAEQAAACSWSDSTAAASLAKLFGTPTPGEPARERTDADRARARMDWSVWPQVLDHLADDPYDADDLYGTALCTYAIGQQDLLERRKERV